MTCPSCGLYPVKRLEVVCELCQQVISAGNTVNPEHIRPIVERVMDEIEDNRKGEAA